MQTDAIDLRKPSTFVRQFPTSRDIPLANYDRNGP